MGRAPCCAKVGLHRGPWTHREDTLLTSYIQAHGEGNWRSLPKNAGLLRCGKSCRLRWMNYLRPDIKRGNITPEEDDLITRMHSLLGNRWSLIAGRLPGRTDNEIKNYWNTHLSKRLRSQGTDPNTHQKLSESPSQQLRISNKNKNMSSKKKKKQVIIKNSKNKAGAVVVDPEKPTIVQVHLPKPIRIRTNPLLIPRNESFDQSNNSPNTSGYSSRQDQKGTIINIVDHGHDYADHNGAEFLIGLDRIECGSSDHYMPIFINEDTNWEKLYDECLQLLKSTKDHDHHDQDQNENDDQAELDSFAESLLI